MLKQLWEAMLNDVRDFFAVPLASVLLMCLVVVGLVGIAYIRTAYSFLSPQHNLVYLLFLGVFFCLWLAQKLYRR